MCGLAGYLTSRLPDGAEIVLDRMAKTLRHRGPDDHGSWSDHRVGVGLAHQRLAILDLSEAGHQPMCSPGGRYVMVFNGEIYNHLEMRKEVESRTSVSWRGHSDTETLLAGFELYGIRAAIETAVGMFAFAVWDRQREVLTLGRDRLGEKPLYYGWQNGTFLFASEL